MKYVRATYRNLYSPAESISFGIVLFTGKEILCKFDNSERRQKLMRRLNNAFDKDTFVNFETTFTDTFIEKGVISVTDMTGHRRQIDVASEEFLTYLAETFLGPYRYSKPASAEGSDPAVTLEALMTRLVLA